MRPHIAGQKEVLHENERQDKHARQIERHCQTHRRSPLLGNETLTDLVRFLTLEDGLDLSDFWTKQAVPECPNFGFGTLRFRAY